MPPKSQITQIRSEAQEFTIASGATGSAVDPVDLGANYDLILVKCDDCSHIAANTTLAAQVGYDDDDDMANLWAQDAAEVFASGTLPTSGALAFVLAAAIAARRIRLVLSNNASGGSVVFSVIGTHKAEE